jgi:hypothetical protein
VHVGAEPRIASIQAAADRARIVVEDNFSTVGSAGKLRVRDFDLRMLVAGHTRIGNSDSPEHRGGELLRLGDWIDVSLLVTDFGRNAGLRSGDICEQQKGWQEAFNRKAREACAKIAKGRTRNHVLIVGFGSRDRQ